MKKIVVLMICILLIGISFVRAEESCIDSDGGNNYYVKGTVIDSSGSYTDLCWDNIEMTEYSCQKENVFATPYNCPNGCKDGACVSIEGECLDSDGGNNYYVKGTARYDWQTDSEGMTDRCINVPGYPQNATEVESCEGFNCFLNEVECINGNPTAYNYNCPYGCQDGACTILEGECIDSDGGKNYYKNGSAKTIIGEGGALLIDSCCIDMDDIMCGKKTGLVVNEAYCRDQTTVDAIQYECEAGCKDGTCIDEGVVCCEKTIEGEWCQNTLEENCDTNFRKTPTFCDATSYCKEFYCSVDATNCPNLNYKEIMYGVISMQDVWNGNEFTFQKVCTAKEDEVVSSSWSFEQPGCAIILEIDEDLRSIEKVQTEPVEVPKEVEGEIVSYICNGCLKENKCYPFGYRKSGKYCFDENEFIGYKEAKESCENNFECKSNVCVNTECLSGSLIRRILNWFRRVFGRE